MANQTGLNLLSRAYLTGLTYCQLNRASSSIACLLNWAYILPAKQGLISHLESKIYPVFFLHFLFFTAFIFPFHINFHFSNFLFHFSYSSFHLSFHPSSSLIFPFHPFFILHLFFHFSFSFSLLFFNFPFQF